jgi:hypothetical protein
LKMDPRVATPAAGLEKQFKLSMQCYEGENAARSAATQARSLRVQAAALRPKAGALADAVAALETKLGELDSAAGEPGLGRTAGELGRLLGLLQAADAEPTSQVSEAVEAARADLDKVLPRWTKLRDEDLKELNARLKAAGLAALDPSVPPPTEARRRRR